VKLQLNRIVKRVAENHKIALTYDQSVIDHVVSRCTELASGGRMIDNILTNAMLPTLSTELLGRMAEGRTVTGIRIADVGGELTYDFVEADGEGVNTERRLEEPVAEPVVEAAAD
jgi:type VI secretion system protein VasG